MHFLFVWILFGFTSPLLSVENTENACVHQDLSDLPGFFADGDIVIGGLFPMHYRIAEPDQNLTYKPATPRCHGFDTRSFRWAQTMRLAIKDVNANPILLPKVQLGYKIHDSCATHVAALRATLSIFNEPKESSSKMCSVHSSLKMIIGDSGSSQSAVVSRLLQPFKIPMISYFSTCSCFGNRQEFPTFFRLVPSDDHQVKAIAKLVKYFGWKWVAAVSEDDDYGRYAFQGLFEEFRKIGVCVAYYEIIPKVYNRKRILEIVDVIKKSTAKVVISFAGEGELYPLFSEYAYQNITGIQWIASEAWVTASLFSPGEFYPSLGGIIGFAIRRGEIPGLKDFLLQVNPTLNPNNSLVKEFWSTMFGCSFYPLNVSDESGKMLPFCSGHESLEEKYSTYLDMSNTRVSYNVYKAGALRTAQLYILYTSHPLSSIHIVVKQYSEEGPAQLPTPYLQQYIQNVSFTIMGEKISFDQSGDPIASYDIINWQKGLDGNIKFVTVGRYDTSNGAGKELWIHEDAIIWTNHQTKASCERFSIKRNEKVPTSVCSESCHPGTRKGVRRGQPLCCFDCLPCTDGETSNQTDSIECTQCPSDFWSNAERTECIPKEIEFLAYDEIGASLTVIALFGACLTFGVLGIFLYYKSTPIVRVNNSELSFFILISLALCFLCSIAFIGEPADWSCMFRHTVFSVTFSLCISCILGKTVVVLMAFKATQPGSTIMKWFGPLQQRIMIFCCTFIQIIICAIWLISMPPFPVKNTKYNNSKIILECHVGSALAFWCVLGYIGVLACMCFVLAFLARKLPGNFNEAKYITFSMLIFCSVWLAFIPAYVSSPGKYTVAVEIFAILASSFGLLFCIFAPKCYIILLKPEKNTKKGILGKSNTNTYNAFN
uniref:G-protein coupled receptors family 3 profile domain-containing protein n=1 Tax=Erpetoichthys calabaricus TaxID=27687 RepID=A0A8C4TLJ4_ERPCA